MLYQDRREAGRILAREVARLPDLNYAIVLGLPRGGVPVAFEVARACKLPLDVIAVRKIGVPDQRELAMGAIAGEGTIVLNQHILRELNISADTLRIVTEREKKLLEEEGQLFRNGLPPLDLTGRTTLLVDDGLATGATMRAAVRAVRAQARRIIIAVPVGAGSTCGDLASEADLVICPAKPKPFDAVGQFYHHFEPTSDDEVRALLAQARREQESRTVTG